MRFENGERLMVALFSTLKRKTPPPRLAFVCPYGGNINPPQREFSSYQTQSVHPSSERVVVTLRSSHNRIPILLSLETDRKADPSGRVISHIEADADTFPLEEYMAFRQQVQADLESPRL
jgi:hypothetical protein